MAGRSILDGVVAENELVDLVKRGKRSCFIFNIDFVKAYNSVNWEFLDYMMTHLSCFEELQRKWVKVVVCSSRMLVLVNESPMKEFVAEKGLKQGDPLVPFLFFIVAKGVHGLVSRSVKLGTFRLLKVDDEVSFSILQYVDDSILFGETSWDNL